MGLPHGLACHLSDAHRWMRYARRFCRDRASEGQNLSSAGVSSDSGKANAGFALTAGVAGLTLHALAIGVFATSTDAVRAGAVGAGLTARLVKLLGCDLASGLLRVRSGAERSRPGALAGVVAGFTDVALRLAAAAGRASTLDLDVAGLLGLAKKALAAAQARSGLAGLGGGQAGHRRAAPALAGF